MKARILRSQFSDHPLEMDATVSPDRKGRMQLTHLLVLGKNRLDKKPIPRPLPGEPLVIDLLGPPFTISQKPAQALTVPAIEGCSGELDVHWTRYERGENFVEVGQDAKLGPVCMTFHFDGQSLGPVFLVRYAPNPLVP